MTDHFAEATRLANSDGAGHGDQGFGQMTDALKAQVHATLALAEQQRVANLIALAESGRTTVNGARAALSALYTGSAEESSAHMALRPDITKALGIKEQNQ